MAGPELTLKWEKFGLSQGLNSMLESGELVDVTIVCQGEFLQAHKTVLAACSQLFRQMFSLNPCKHPVIFMQDVQLMHMKSLMTFMYTGETTVLQRELTGFMNTAEALKISGLTTTQDTPHADEGRSVIRPRPSKRPRMSQPGPSRPRQQQQMIMDDVKVENEELCELSPDPDDDNLMDDYDTELVTAELGDDMEPLPGTSIVNEADIQEVFDDIQPGPSGTHPVPGPSGVSSRDIVELGGEVCEVIVVTTSLGNNDDKPVENLKCNFCDRQVKSKHSLRTHIRNYHSADSGTGHACEICNKKYTLKCGLQVHMRNIHGDKAVPVDCQDCGKTFPNKMAHYKHVSARHHYRISNKKPTLENVTGSGFQATFDENRNREYTVSCRICDKDFLSWYRLNRHMKDIHDIEDDMWPDFSNCNIGNEQTETSNEPLNVDKEETLRPYSLHDIKIILKKIPEDEINEHIQSTAKFVCNFCEETFTRQSSLDRHKNSLHKSIPETQPQAKIKLQKGKEKQNLKCDACDASFKTAMKLRLHMTMVHNKFLVNKWKCELCCAPPFQTRDMMTSHKKESHKENYPFKCKLCSWRSVKPHNLIQHMMKYHRDK